MASLDSWVKAEPSGLAIQRPFEALKISQGGLLASLPVEDPPETGVFVAAGCVALAVGMLGAVAVAFDGWVGDNCVGTVVRVSLAVGSGGSVSVAAAAKVSVGLLVVGVEAGFTPEVKMQLIRKIMRVESITSIRWLKLAPFEVFMISS